MESNEKMYKGIWDEVVKSCKICNGEGCVSIPSINGVPSSRECECSAKAKRYFRYSDAGIDKEYWDLTIDDFVGDKYAKIEIVSYLGSIEDMKKKGTGAVFCGSNGTGKTLASILILKEADKIKVDGERKYKIQFKTVSELLELIKESQGYTDKAEQFKEEYRFITQETDFLVLDNMGSEYMKKDNKEFPISKFDTLFRFRGRNMLPTFITTNYTEQEFRETYGKSIDSLLSSRSKFLEINGEDFRKNCNPEAK